MHDVKALRQFCATYPVQRVLSDFWNNNLQPFAYSQAYSYRPNPAWLHTPVLCASASSVPASLACLQP